MKDRINNLEQNFCKLERRLKRFRFYWHGQNLVAAIMIGFCASSLLKTKHDLSLFILNFLALFLWALTLYKSIEYLKENQRIANNIQKSKPIVFFLHEVADEIQKNKENGSNSTEDR